MLLLEKKPKACDMIISIFYIILALLGITFLVFIHELGHYFVAKKVGMRVEVFSIGMGKPICSWMHKGVKWQICYLPIGGYVRIAGMEKVKNKEPHEIKDGFYGKKPLDRIKVAIMGPIVNIVFALFAFTLIWAFGGRDKPFAEFTSLIGAVDTHSELYQKGVRPGDEILEYNGETFDGYKDLIFAGIMNGRSQSIEGLKIDYFTGQTTPFDYTLDPYTDTSVPMPDFKTLGILAPARYLIFDRFPGSNANKLPVGSPMENSGIAYGDRIIWANGQIIFSNVQFSDVVNDDTALLTIQRDRQTLQVKVPRVLVADLRIPSHEKAELDDWQHEIGLSKKSTELIFIPYNLTRSCIVENPLTYLDESADEVIPIDLKAGDQILAVDGQRVTTAFELLQKIQQKNIQVVVQRNTPMTPMLWKDEDRRFIDSVKWSHLSEMVTAFGTDRMITVKGDLEFLNPIVPIKRKDSSFYSKQIQEQRVEIRQIRDPIKRRAALKHLNAFQDRFILGVALQDKTVRYNPTPFKLFGNVFEEIYKTFSALIMGYLSPKYMAGPIGIVQVVQKSWMVGFKEVLFWLGAISLNLGILNLLPIPVLDGGHICISIYEGITKKPLKTKVRERLIIPFIILLIFFFIYVTYNDILRIFGRFFR